MKRYELKIEEVGLTKGTISTRIKNMIREFKAAEEELAELENNYESEQDDAQKEVLKEKIDDYKNTLSEVEDEICKKIEDWAKKKPIYEQNIKRMQDGRKAKLAGGEPKAGNPPAPEDGSQQTPPAAAQGGNEPAPPAPAPVAPAAPAANEPISVVAEEIKDEKKSSGTGLIIGGILLVASILIGVNLVKNKD